MKTKEQIIDFVTKKLPRSFPVIMCKEIESIDFALGTRS